jgi:glutaredoxin 3
MIAVYSKEICPYCDMAKRWLTQNNLEFTVISLDKDEDKMEFYKKTGCKSVPQIFLNDTHIGGYQELIKSDLIKTLLIGDLSKTDF